MSNSPNMSYCMFENTMSALNQIQDYLEDSLSSSKTFEDILNDASSKYERDAMNDFRNKLEELIEVIDELNGDEYNVQTSWGGHQ